jgi:hypothetical protein
VARDPRAGHARLIAEPALTAPFGRPVFEGPCDNLPLWRASSSTEPIS